MLWSNQTVPQGAARLAVRLVVSLVVALVARDAPAGLVGAWTFDDPERLGRDASPNENHADPFHVTFETVGPPDARPYGHAARFVAGGGYLEVPSSPTLQLGEQFTVSLWVDRQGDENATGSRYLLSKGAYQHASPVQLYFDAGQLRLRLGATVIPFDHLDLFEQWHHLLLTVRPDGDRVRVAFSLDGELISEHGLADVQYSDGDGPLVLGALDHLGGKVFSFEGGLDDVALWDEALAPGKARAMHTAAGALHYNAVRMQQLFDVFDSGPGASVEIDTLRWHYATGLAGEPGDVLSLDGPAIVLDASGNGLRTTPEPGALMLLATGLWGIAFRRRRCNSRLDRARR